ncbi:MAG TPA: outer membrane beta-barrel protein [Alphaproteobacteria bacterium]
MLVLGEASGSPRRRRALALALGCIVLFGATAAANRPASAADIRLEAGFGLAYTDDDLSFDERLGRFDLEVQSNSTLGGAGVIGSAAVWFDRVLTDNLSIGLEYLRSATDGDLTINVSGLGQNVTLDTDYDLDIDTLFLTVAWRRNTGDVHPYVGIGIGTSWLDGSIDARATTTVLGFDAAAAVAADEDAFAPSAQAVFGFDYDVTHRFYVGGVARLFVIDGRLFNVDQVIRELSAQIKIGVRF